MGQAESSESNERDVANLARGEEEYDGELSMECAFDALRGGDDVDEFDVWDADDESGEGEDDEDDHKDDDGEDDEGESGGEERDD